MRVPVGSRHGWRRGSWLGCTIVSVDPGPRTWNVTSSDPMRMSSPSARWIGAVTREFPRNVPFLLPKSSSIVPPRCDHQPCVTPRHRRLVQPDLDIGIAPDHMFTGGKRKASPAPLQPARGSRAVRSSGVRDVKRLTAERIAESVRCSDEKRTSSTVSEGLTNLSDQVREIRLGDERFRPQPLLQHVFRKNLRPIQDQRPQQLESLRRQMDVVASARQLPRVEIEHEWAEAERHGSCLDKTCGFPGNPLRLARAWSIS